MALVNRPVNGANRMEDPPVISRDGLTAAFATWNGDVSGVFAHDLAAGERRAIWVDRGYARIEAAAGLPEMLLWAGEAYDADRGMRRLAWFTGPMDGSVSPARVDAVEPVDFHYYAHPRLSAGGARVAWVERNDGLERLKVAPAALPAQAFTRFQFPPDVGAAWVVRFIGDEDVIYYLYPQTFPATTSYWRINVIDGSEPIRLNGPLPEGSARLNCVFHDVVDGVLFTCIEDANWPQAGGRDLLVGDVAVPGVARRVNPGGAREIADSRYVSHDGRWLLFMSRTGDAADVFLVDLADPSAEAAMVVGGMVPGSGFFPFGDRIAFSPQADYALVSGRSEVYRLDLSSPALPATLVVELTEETPIQWVQVLPGDTHFIVHHSDRNWLAPLAGADELESLIPHPPSADWVEGYFVPLP